VVLYCTFTFTRFASPVPFLLSWVTTISPSAGVTAHSVALTVNGTWIRSPGLTTSNAPLEIAEALAGRARLVADHGARLVENAKAGQPRTPAEVDILEVGEQALEEVGVRTGVDDVAMFVGAVAQSKRIGSELGATLRDQELMVRMNQRNRSTAKAAAVGTKLLAVLGGIYLPEFVILIVIPLFWGIMQRAFG